MFKFTTQFLGVGKEQIDKDISLTERLAKLGIGIPGNPASTSHTIITRQHQQSALQHASSLLGQEETIDIEEQPVEETRNNSTPESTEQGSPTNENSGLPKEKSENSPDKSTSSSFFSTYEKETMSEGGSSTPKPKLREDRTQTQMMIEILTAVLEEMEKKKNKGTKVAAPDPFEGDRKDTKRFLMEVEIYLQMHPTEYDTDKKKCLFLLSYLRGKNTESWKNGQSRKIFEPKSGETALTYQVLKDEFKKHYLLADIQAEAQIKIEEAKMTDRADNYVNDFRVMADESGYDDQALIHIFRKGLPNSLSAKILNQPQGRPTDLEGWYKAAIRYDEQYKYYEASRNSMHIPLVYNNETGKVGTNVLLDSGAGGLFMSPEKASKLGLERTKLPHRIKVFNVDGTANKTAWIMQSVMVTYNVGTKRMIDTFLILGLGREEVILGLPWLRKYNPEVDWITGRTMFPTKRYIRIPCIAGVLDFESPEELIHRIDIRAKLSTSQ
ncbi:hypothetical protein WG66_000675 [Moniliophthora roreri]|nr:hypothetical protein WG66_000675 [Moniliophthora roreri]